ncbi:vesicle transport through interaction with t-SNAREs homolog 1A-like [Actinia tenebrosa]|uniref:Vesicle transport through interaction with t-SNAREs homolog 1A-like n=1 Tax=Actinia tenebrosa TaxID=6105 RepID=A0A6P8HUZ0_ACTTE|nr:vesicle transport through interaction with t-SNAREs homolog 1A-like [Actinia tenebrosa]
MSELFNNYEQQFGTLSAEITAKICKIPNLHGEAKRTAVGDVERGFDEANELLEQMDLEMREMSGNEKAKISNRLKTYKSEMKKFQQDLRKAKIAFSDQEGRNELLGSDDPHCSEDQRTRLLDNTERVDRTGRRLEEGYKMCIETEEEPLLGTTVKYPLRGTDQHLSKSSRVLTAMMRRVIQNRIIMAVICLVILGVIGIIIYVSVKKKS